MATPDEAWLALYSLHYWGEYGRYGLESPSQIDALFAPVGPGVAVDTLTNYHPPDKTGSQYRRLAIAAICRASDSLPVNPDPHTLVSSLAAAESLQPFDVSRLQQIITLPDYALRFSQALAHLVPQIQEFNSSTVSFCPSALVSTIQVAAHLQADANALQNEVNARNWHLNVPQIWSASDIVLGGDGSSNGAPPPTFTADRDTDPPLKNDNSQAPWAESLFFESFKWVTGGGIQLGKIRNLLAASFNVDAAGGSTFTFRLAECLSTDFAFQGTHNQGGMNRDSGFAIVNPLADNECTLTVRKSIRFTQPKRFLLAMNEAAFINTLLLLELLVMSAVQ